MSPTRILQALREDLAEYVAEQKGTTSVAKDPWQPIEILADRPTGFRVILLWAGDEPDGSNELHEAEGILPSVLCNVEVYVSLNLGLVRDPGTKLFEDDGATPLVERVNEIRARVLSLAFEFDGETLGRFRYRGCAPVVTPEGWPLTAYKLKFGIVSVCDVYEDREVEL